MVKTYSSKKSAIVTGRPRRTQTNAPVAKGSRSHKTKSSSDSSRLPISETLLSLTEQEGREIAVAFSENLTSEGVLSAFSDKLRAEILRRSPRDSKGNLIKTRECGRPEDLKHLTYPEIRHLPLKRCLLCGYIASRGHTTARHSAAHGDHNKMLVDVPWQVCLVKDAVPSGSMEDFSSLLMAHSGHKPMLAYKQAGSPPAATPYPGSATCLISATGQFPSRPTGVASPAASGSSLEASPVSVHPAPRSLSPVFGVPELEMPMPVSQSWELFIDPLLLGPYSNASYSGAFFSPASYHPALNADYADAATEINMMIDQSERFATFEPYAQDDDNEAIRAKRAWNHLQNGGQLDYTPLTIVC